MTSQISLSKLMKIDIRSRKWLIILSSVIQMVFGPVAGLMSITTKGSYTIQYAIDRAFDIEFAVFETGIVIVGAVLTALIGFRFLFSKRMMDLYGSIPVSRNRLFAAVYINNFLTWFIPFITSIALTAIMCIAVDRSYVVPILTMAGKYLLSGLFAFLIIYHMCLVAVMISGHAFVAISNIVMMGLAVICVYGIVYYYAVSYFNSFSQFALGSADVAWLSPLAAPIYVPGLVNDSYFTGVEYGVFIVGSIILLIINLFLAGFLFKIRKSELAEGGTKIRPYVIVIRSIASLIAGVYLSFIFSIFAVGTVYVWCVIGIIIGAFASFGIVNMILYRTGRAFFKDKFIMIGTVVFSVLFYTAFAADLIGYDSYVPAENHIVKAEIHFSDYYDDGISYTIEGDKIVDTSWNSYDTGYYTCEDTELVHELLEAGAKRAKEKGHESISIFESLINDNYNDTYYQFSTTVKVKVYLSNGTSYYRSYNIKVDEPIIDKIANSPEYIEKFYPISTGAIDIPPAKMNFYTYGAINSVDIELDDPELMEMILECYRRDFAENTVLNSFDSYASLDLEYPVYEKDREWYDDDGNIVPYHSTYAPLRVGEDYMRTQCILEILSKVNYDDYKYNQGEVNKALKEAIQEVLDLG